MRALKAVGAVFAVFAVFVLAAQARASAPSVLVDGEKLYSDVPAIETNGHILVPLRPIMEKLGAIVSYDVKSQTVTAEVGDRVVYLTIGSSRAYVNGSSVALEAPARTFAGRTEVPLRFVGQALGAVVDYDAATDTAVVITGRTPGNFVAALSGGRYSSAYAGGGLPPSVQDERPAPNSVIGSAYPEVYARLGGGSAAVDPASITVTLDGYDVTSQATISAAYVSYTPAHRLDNGEHRVEISGRSDEGAPFDETWSFNIDAGYSSDFVSSVVDYAPGPYGYSRFGFFPPGFSLFVPGPQFFFAGNVIEIVFYSPFFPYGNCFMSITGLPGVFACNPWNGFPGYFYSYITVPYGVVVNNGTVICNFRSFSGPRVVVHATAPITINGKRTTLPSNMRFINVAMPVHNPTSPYHLVVVQHPALTIEPGLSGRKTLPTFVNIPASAGHPSTGTGQTTNVNSNGSGNTVKAMPVTVKPLPANSSSGSSSTGSSGNRSGGNPPPPGHAGGSGSGNSGGNPQATPHP